MRLGGRGGGGGGGALAPGLRAFLDDGGDGGSGDGNAPVCVTFGSMAVVDGTPLLARCVLAARAAGRRVVLVGGWSERAAGLAARLGGGGCDCGDGNGGGDGKGGESRARKGGAAAKAKAGARAPWLYFARAAPFSALFPRCACVVFHGGAGTFATALRAGTPSVIVPILRWYDQDGWAATAEALGVGVACHGDPADQREEEGDDFGIADNDESGNEKGVESRRRVSSVDFPVPGIAQLRDAIAAATTPACRGRAAALAEVEGREDGAGRAAALLTGCLCDRLRAMGESEASVATLAHMCVPCRARVRNEALAVVANHTLLEGEKASWAEAANSIPDASVLPVIENGGEGRDGEMSHR